MYTDDFRSYWGLGHALSGGHKIVNHRAHEYVNGDANTNTAESFFALLKRGVVGMFHHVSKRHLPRYCDEFSFRWDHRKTTDGERMVSAIKQSEGKRLIYRLTVGGVRDKHWGDERTIAGEHQDD
jgi:hypothetical protein